MKAFMLSRLTLVVVFTLMSFVFASATHLRGGYIRVKRIDQNSLNFLITLTVFTNSANSSVPVGGDDGVSYLYFGDGGRIFVPTIYPKVVPDTDGKIGVVEFTVNHVYSSYQRVTLSFQEPNRNAGVVNAINTISSLFYIETSINLDAGLDLAGDGIVSGPTLLTTPIFQGAVKSDFTASVAAWAPDGFSNFYTLAAPLKGPGTPLDDYKIPDSFKLNRFNGQISWDTKFKNGYTLGEYSFAVRIFQFNGEREVCSMLVDFQVILGEEAATNPLLTDNADLDENNRVYVPDGVTRKIRVFAEDAPAQTIGLRLYWELSNIPVYGYALSLSEYDSIHDGRNIHVGLIAFTGYPDVIRATPYSVSVRAAYARSDGTIYRDLSYLWYTTDTELVYPDPVLAVHTDDDAVGLRAYPNPVEDFLYLDWTGVRSIQLYAMTGELILQETAGATKAIDFRNQKPGMYFLKYECTDRKGGVMKIVKRG
jgi:hypothetical protein